MEVSKSTEQKHFFCIILVLSLLQRFVNIQLFTIYTINWSKLFNIVSLCYIDGLFEWLEFLDGSKALLLLMCCLIRTEP